MTTDKLRPESDFGSPAAATNQAEPVASTVPAPAATRPVGEYMHADPSVPGAAAAYWLASDGESLLPERGRHDNVRIPASCDIAVIGAGLTGLLVAQRLAERGADVCIIEARSAGTGVSGHTTAKLTVQHGAVYARLEQVHGEDGARIYAEANRDGIEHIRLLADHLDIDCDLATVDSFVYSQSTNGLERLEDECSSALQAGLAAELLDGRDVGLPFQVGGAVAIPGQWRFHPVKFMAGVRRALDRAGVTIVEGVRVHKIDEDDQGVAVITDDGTVRCKDAVVATHYPFHDYGSLFTRLYPYTAYVLGLYLDEPLDDALYVGLDDEPTLRLQPTDSGQMLIASGETHRVGADVDERKEYRSFIGQINDRMRIGNISWHWSTQHNATPDQVPFIGRSPGADHVWIGTGYNGWGMSHSGVAAIILGEQLLGKSDPYVGFFDPGRFSTEALGRFARANTHVLAEFIGTLVPEGPEVDALANGEATVVRRGLSRIGVYRDFEGSLHAVSTSCTHMRCGLRFNDAEKTWDCPCHGSRFDYDGEVIHSPAVERLRPYGGRSR